MNELSGTTGLGCAADGSYLLKRDKRESNNTTLELMCRDLPEKKVKLIFNRQFTKWELDSIEDELWILVKKIYHSQNVSSSLLNIWLKNLSIH